MELLRKLPLFSSLTVDVIQELTGKYPRKSFKAGEVLMKQGEKGKEVFLLTEGKVEVQAESQFQTKATVVFHEAPYLLGEIEIWNEYPFLGSAIAVEPCRVIVLSKKDFVNLLHSHHQIAINLARSVSHTLYAAAREMRIRTFGHTEHLVAHALLVLAQMYGVENEYGTLVRRDINKSALAVKLGIARRSVIRALQTLEEHSLIEIHNKQLVIPDLGRLRRKANEPFPH